MTELLSDELDAWRNAYLAGELSYEQHRELYVKVAEAWPEQNYFDAHLVSRFMDWARPAHVVELGGWDGALANSMLRRHERIRSWTNYEIADVPQLCTRPEYRCVVPEEMVWELGPIEADAFIASHVLEHLTASDFLQLLGALRVEFAYVDLPLSRTENDWAGTLTTHALTYTIDQFDQAWQQHGYRVRERHFREGEVGAASHVRYLRYQGR